MHILEPADYDTARPLFEALDDQLAVSAILECTAPARIYVDDPIHSQAAFTWTGHRFFLAGSPGDAGFNEAVRRLFAEKICPQALASGLKTFELKYAPADWEKVIPGVILRGKNPIKARRHYYRFRKLKHDWRGLLPEGFRLAFIDRALLEQAHLKHLDNLMEELCSERASVEDFLDKSFGVVALHDDELAGWCTSEYNSGNRCEVGIGTLEPYQRRGLATAMGSAFVEHALACGITQIGWHCWANNAPSIATALKIGFERVCEYATFIITGQAADPVARPDPCLARRRQ
ncbi:MAG: GNAT family N-acetyltransferase [Chloroflexi bacterium]|nr:GNAT family N-acetyltransferase [Chloroflexota bacterium]